MRVAILSLKFSPGHYSHVVAMSKLFQSLGFETLLVLDKQYNSFASDNTEERFLFTDGLSECQRFCDFGPDLCVIYNLSIYDLSLISKLRRRKPSAKAALVYHEPYRGLGETLGALVSGNRGLDHTKRILGRHLFSTKLLKRCNQIWLPSKSACVNYTAFDVRYNANYLEFPLVFNDEADEECLDAPKEYFSFISTALPAKGFEEFLLCVKGMAKLDSEMKFQIVTKTDVSKHLDNDLRRLEAEGRLLVEHGRPHSNEAINAAYNRSLCTWFGYNVSTQSGVLCKSFMFGSPGVATRVGAFGEYIDGTNSIFIEDNSNVQEVYEAYQRIAADSQGFIRAARSSFLKYFHYINYVDLMAEIVTTLGISVKSEGELGAL